MFNLNYVYELPFFVKQEGFTKNRKGIGRLAGVRALLRCIRVPFTAVTSNLDLAGLGLINANPAARKSVV